MRNKRIPDYERSEKLHTSGICNITTKDGRSFKAAYLNGENFVPVRGTGFCIHISEVETSTPFEFLRPDL